MLFAVVFTIAMIVGLIRRRIDVTALLSVMASLLLIIEAVKGISFSLSFSLLGFTLNFVTDWMSRYFCILVGISGVAVSIYTLGYMKPRHLSSAAYPLFLLSMALIVLSRDFVTFILFWELMTLSSFVLILNDYERDETKNAGLLYLVAMHALNTAPLLLAVGGLYALTGNLSYSSLQGVEVPPWILYAFMLGFMAKAGIVPLHFWLPEAHPVAPSNISALLSGTMLKMAVYGMLLVATLFTNSSIIAIPLVVLAIMTIVIGSLLALIQRDIKRLMAYSSIDNMGYIFLTLGAYLLLDGTLKKMALAALLLHSLNHLIFKNLLFMLSGNVLHATGRKDIGLRGLSKAMPYTMALSVIGILAVSGIPPTNGFVSKWLIYQTAFLSDNPLLVLGGITALLGSALTLAAYMKFYRIFTGRPNVEAHEANGSMLAGEIIPAALCIILGVFPWAALNLVGIQVQVQLFLSLPLLVLVVMLSFSLLAALLPPRGRKDEVWTNGEPVEDFEIEPEHMYQPINSYGESISRFGTLVGTRVMLLFEMVSLGNVYLDEIMLMPFVRVITGIASVMKELSKGLNLMLATTFLAMIGMVIVFLIIMGVV